MVYVKKEQKFNSMIQNLPERCLAETGRHGNLANENADLGVAKNGNDSRGFAA
jgi:hypothetical protein